MAAAAWQMCETAAPRAAHNLWDRGAAFCARARFGCAVVWLSSPAKSFISERVRLPADLSPAFDDASRDSSDPLDEAGTCVRIGASVSR